MTKYGPLSEQQRQAIKRSEADLVSAWDTYAVAIDVAKNGKVTRLANLLHAYRPLTDADHAMLGDYVAALPGGHGLLRALPLGEQDFDTLADFVVAMNRGQGRWRDEKVRAIMRMAEALIPVARGAKTEKGKAIQDPIGAAIDCAIAIELGPDLPDAELETLREQVRDRLNRPLARRY
jgi:hypothetical protein